jgi:hypothetical protein
VPPPAFGGGGPVPPPSLGLGGVNVAAPSFLQQEEEEEPPEEEIRVVEKVVQITDDGSVEESEVGRINVAPAMAVVATILMALLFGYIGGGQIDRAVRANHAIDGALTIHEAVVQDQELCRGLKSRISGAARIALHPTEPQADFELLDYLSKVRQQQPFSAAVWSTQFYQAFKAAPLMFEYYRSVQALWASVDEVAKRYEEPSIRAGLKAWPQKRNEILQIVAPDETSGFAVTFFEQDGKVLGRFGAFRNGAREATKEGEFTKAEVTPLGGGEATPLFDYPPGLDAPISDEPTKWFIRINPVTIVGPKRDLVNHAGPIVAKTQEPFRQYLSDLNELSKNIQSVQGNQDNLIQALTEIRGARRPFTFGF